MIDGTSAGRPLAPRVLAFVGDDPGQRGATCLLGVLDDPDGTRHGEVVYCAVWDRVLRKTDRGEHVDPVHFAEQVRRHAIEAGVVDRVALHIHSLQVDVARVVIEVPRVGGRKFSGIGVVTQGANYGIILAVSLCSSEFRAEVVEDADPAAGQWYDEAGAELPKGKDRKRHSCDLAADLVAAWSRTGVVRVDLPRGGFIVKKDGRADALLLAHLGVLRWLGRAAVADRAGEKAARRSKVKDARDHEVARAMYGVDRKAMRKVPCPRCGALTVEKCEGGKSTCRERVWAAAAASKPATLITDSADLHAFLEAMRDAPAGNAIACAQGVWRRVLTDGTRSAKVSRQALDAAIDAGMVRLTLDARRRPVWVTTFRETTSSC